jgi:hypothetical protein
MAKVWKTREMDSLCLVRSILLHRLGYERA